jgi:hypothetical protein
MGKKKIQWPQKGDRIYVPTSLHVFRGRDDFMGGLATINAVDFSTHLPEDHYNYCMVGIETRPGTMYNYRALLEKQAELEKEFGTAEAHPDPDYRPEFNDDNEGWH